MEVGWRGIGVGVLLLAVLGGAVAYSLWPEGPGDGPRPDGPAPAEEHRKSLAQRVEELEQRAETYADAGVAVLAGRVENGDGKPVPFAEVWITAGDSVSAIDALTCETCGAGLFECPSAQSAREVLALARAGKLAPRPLATARADAQGRFTFATVPAAELTVHARAPGFSDGSQAVDLSEPLEPDGEDAWEAVIQLPVPAPMRVMVVDDEEKPVRGAAVAILDREAGTVTDRVSDDRGFFDVNAPPDSVVWMFIEARGFLPAVVHDFYLSPEMEEDGAQMVRLERPHRLRVETRLSGQLVDATIEVTGLEHPHQAVARGGIAIFEDLPSGELEVAASYQQYVSPKQRVELGGEAEAVVRVDLKPAARLSVGVFDERGEPVAEARVSVEGYGNSELEITDDTGALLLFDHLAEGTYQVHVEADGLRDAQRRVDLRAGDNHLEVTLQKASMLSGRVLDGDGKAVASATVELVSQIHEAAATTSDENGEFQLQVDEPGAYRLRARDPQLGVVVAQVSAPAEGLVLRLEPLARIEVHVLGAGVPIKAAYVSIFGVGPASDDSGTAVTDERGVGRLAGLHGGEYMINVEQTGFQRAEPHPVKLAPNGKVEVTIALEKGVEISGKVVDETGRPVPNADVHTGVEEANKNLKGEPTLAVETSSAFSDENGDFSLEGLKPGHTYSISASSEDRAMKAAVKVKAAAAGLTLKVEPLPGVKGRVLDEAGQPLASFRVDGREFQAVDGRFVVGREADFEGKLYLNVDADGYESLSVEHEFTADVGDLRLKKAPLVRGVVVDALGQPVSGADVTCDQCIDSTTSGSDGAFTLAVSQGEPEPTITAAKLNHRGKTKAPPGPIVTVKLEPPVRVDGTVKDPSGRLIQARIIVREINGGEEERVDSGPDGKFELDLPEGLWMFITRLSSTGQMVKVVPPRTVVVLGAPPGSCAVTITVTEPVGDAWLVPGEPQTVPLESLDDDALYSSAVALDLPLPNRPTRSAGLQCGVYTLITTDSSGVRRERVDVRASEAAFTMAPAPPAAAETADASPNHPGQP